MVLAILRHTKFCNIFFCILCPVIPEFRYSLDWNWKLKLCILDHHPSTCVHPESREAVGKKRVIVPSLPHRSSGSTVDSLMLDDDEASSVLSGYQPSVDAIPEELDDNDGGGD